MKIMHFLIFLCRFWNFVKSIKSVQNGFLPSTGCLQKMVQCKMLQCPCHCHSSDPFYSQKLNFIGPGVLACATRGGGRSEAGHCFHLLFSFFLSFFFFFSAFYFSPGESPVRENLFPPILRNHLNTFVVLTWPPVLNNWPSKILNIFFHRCRIWQLFSNFHH